MPVPQFRVWVPDAGQPGHRYCAGCKETRHSTFHQATRHDNGRPVGRLIELCERCWYAQLECLHDG